MSEINFFDANACLGRSMWRTPGSPYDLGGLLGEMDHCRITRALVYHSSARELDSQQGNTALLREIDNQARLVPAAVISAAPYSGERNPARELDELIEKGFKAFRVFPLYHKTDPHDPEFRQFLVRLEERGMALWLDYDNLYYNLSQLGQHEQRQIDLAATDRLAADFPGLTLVIVGANYTQFTALFRLFDRRPNVRVETSLFQGLGKIRFVCERWGAERLLFGTGLPFTSPGAARATLMYEEISDDDKQKIASANLEALVKEGKTPTLAEDPARSPLMAAVDQGKKLEGTPLLDAHGHIAPQGFDGIFGLSLGPQDAASIVKRMDRVGISLVAVSSWELSGGDALAGNRVAWEAAQQFPGRFLPYAVVNPNYPEDWPQLIRECFSDTCRFFGLKPYPFSQRLPLSDPSYREMLELAQRLRLPILCHFGFESLNGVTPEEIATFAPRYPEATFIVAHSGASYRVARALIPVVEEFPNVLLDMNYTSVPFGMVSYLVEKAGPERILFGTDMPMRDPAPILGWIVYDHITDQQKRKILGLNFQNLIRRTGYPGLLKI
jgi:predicted TIM-barrel fold metal-dependent hydrolase